MSQPISLRYPCPHCQAPNQAANLAVGSQLDCIACDWSRPVAVSDLDAQSPTRCLACGNDDLWRQKDFPQMLGMAFVAIGAVGSSIAWYYHRPVIALGVLLFFAALDFVLFALMPDVLVCYRCHARHSGGEINEHPAFDHETAERYRQEQLRLNEHPTASAGRT